MIAAIMFFHEYFKVNFHRLFDEKSSIGKWNLGAIIIFEEFELLSGNFCNSESIAK